MDDDSIIARIPPSSPAPVSEVLLRAWHHDLAGLKPLLSTPGRASIQEPTTGETPLHAAIRACGDRTTKQEDDEAVLARAEAVVQELFLSGAIWNDVDSRNETPGCVAERLGLARLYDQCVAAGVRAELLFGLLDGYEELSSAGDDDGEAEGEGEQAAVAEEAAAAAAGEGNKDEKSQEEEGEQIEVEVPADAAANRAFVPPAPASDPNVRSEDYLQSDLSYDANKLVDSAQNGVMMAWETSIMRESVDVLLPGLPAGKRILNIGFGMGIVDAMFRETKPARHHIVEAHPAVLQHIASSDSEADGFGKAWEASGPEDGAYKVHPGRWQDVLPGLLEKGEMYDAIYFDTFGEDYAQLRTFFTEFVTELLEPDGGVFSFFNGLGADRRICYDVYTKVVEMHLSDANMDVEWKELDVDMQDGGLAEEGKGEWEGVKRRYWTLDKYRLPICTFVA